MNTASKRYKRSDNLKVFQGQVEDTEVRDIRDEYGIETIQKIRQFESISRTSGRYRSTTDDGRYHLSKIYDKFIRSSVTLKTPSHGGKDGSEDNNF